MASTLSLITLSELQSLLHSLNLPSDTRLTVIFEDNVTTEKIFKRKKMLAAMKKLKGSGNGNLVSVLLEERTKDKLK
jgi:hypothetical protein